MVSVSKKSEIRKVGRGVRDMPDGEKDEKAGILNSFRADFKLGRTVSTGDIEELLTGVKRSKQLDFEGTLAKDKGDREVLKKSRLQVTAQAKKEFIKQAEINVLLKKLEKLDRRIKDECNKVGEDEVRLREEDREEREEFMRKWEEEKQEMSGRLQSLKKRLETLEQGSLGEPLGCNSSQQSGVIDNETEKMVNKSGSFSGKKRLD